MAFLFNDDTGSIAGVLTLDPGANPLTISGTQGVIVSTGTTAQRPTPANGMIRNNSDLVIPEVYANGSWQAMFGRGGRGYNSFFDDFLIDNAAVSNPFGRGWTPSTAGTGASVNGISSVVSSGNNNLGVVEVAAGTTTAGVAGAALSVQSVLLGYGTYYGEWRVSIPTLSTAGQQYVFYVGFIDDSSTTGDMGDSIYFEYRQATDTHWRFATSTLGTRTKTNSATTVTAGAWVTLGILVNAAATLATFFINGASVGTINTNIPTTTGDTVGNGFKIVKNAGTTSRSGYVDYMQTHYSLTTTR